MADDKLSVKMLQIFVGFLVVVGISCQELVVTHAPEYVSFHHQDSQIKTSEVPDIIASTLGLNTQSENSFKGISHKSVFKKPKANVLITMVTEGKQTSPMKMKSVARFPLENDFMGFSMENVINSLQNTFLDQDPLMVDMIQDSNMFNLQTENQLFRKLPNSLRKVKDRLFDDDSILRKLDSKSLNMTVDSDSTLMGELQMIDDVVKTLKTNKKSTKSNSPDLLSFTITGINKISEKHGVKSDKVDDAKNMVTDFIHHITNEFKNLYKDNVVVEVLTLTPHKGHVRKARSLMAVTTPSPAVTKNLNLAEDYDAIFPAIFNIILWMMVLLAIWVYVIVYGMWFMDPGRDSIIYRMTSQRLKKD